MTTILDTLTATIRTRKSAEPQHSYVASCFTKGRSKMAQKVGEEGVELALALTADDPEEITKEAADLVFHMLIALEDAGLSIDDVFQELQRREGVSGIDEKRQRE